jgi:DNA mismatch repair ATPase MutS
MCSTRWLSVRDPFNLTDLVRGGFLLRVLLVGSFLDEIARERARLQRLLLWLGELDAAAAIADLRAERDDLRVPELVAGARAVAATELIHPAIADAVGNDLAIDRGMVITGSNMSGKSTFLRAIAINAICAQSLHTTFGGWRAGLYRVFAVMRIADEPAAKISTYAAEVAAIGTLVTAAASPAPPALFAIDEPFRGTSPTLRVPIVVATLDFLARDHVVLAATHDLEVAAQVSAGFVRGYFTEPDGAADAFDHKLRLGVNRTSNALRLLIQAGYPEPIIAAVRRQLH